MGVGNDKRRGSPLIPSHGLEGLRVSDFLKVVIRRIFGHQWGNVPATAPMVGEEAPRGQGFVLKYFSSINGTRPGLGIFLLRFSDI